MLHLNFNIKLSFCNWWQVLKAIVMWDIVDVLLGNWIEDVLFILTIYYFFVRHLQNKHVQQRFASQMIVHNTLRSCPPILVFNKVYKLYDFAQDLISSSRTINCSLWDNVN